MHPIELIAATLALAYLVLAIREHRACFIAATLSCGLYVWVFAVAALYMEAVLQLFYIAMAVYGWFAWGRDNSAEQLPIQRWPMRRHLSTLAAILILSGISGYLLDRNTDAALPWADSFTTIAALFTTWMVVRKVLENWIYWIVIDAVSIVLYLERDLNLTAGLFGGYVLLAAAGFASWLQHYRRQTPVPGGHK